MRHPFFWVINMEKIITFEDFTKVDLRIGTIIEVHDFPKARRPAYQLTIDFGDLGVKKSSAQITTQYQKEDLIQRQIVAVVNFPRKTMCFFYTQKLRLKMGWWFLNFKLLDIFLLHKITLSYIIYHNLQESQIFTSHI